MIVLHVGLGKTATTSLQRHIFPILENMGIVESFNDPYLIKELQELSKHRQTSESNTDLKTKIQSAKNLFISLEQLIEWDPEYWESGCENLLRSFGKDVTILITVREPEAYLRDVYQQVVHQGHVVKPESFFLNDTEYKNITQFVRPGRLDIFNADAFNLEKLISLHADSFSKVVVVPLENIRHFKFAQEIWGIGEDLCKRFTAIFDEGRRYNVSYSQLAMQLTFAKESFLKNLGAKSIDSNDVTFNTLMQSILTHKGIVSKDQTKYSELTFMDKITQTTFRLLRRLRGGGMLWRRLMQGIVNKIFPYRQYELPEATYLGKELETNKRFYEDLLRDKKGYRVYEEGTHRKL